MKKISLVLPEALPLTPHNCSGWRDRAFPPKEEDADYGEVTLFIRREHLLEALKLEDVARDNDSFVTTIDAVGSFDLKGRTVNGRMHAASCYSRECFSVTIRGRGVSKIRLKNTTGHLHSPDWPSQRVVCETFELFRKNRHNRKGLVLVAGATGTGKTDIVNLLLASYIKREPQDLRLEDRLPHIVVIGDPVETVLPSSKKDLPESLKAQTEGEESLPFNFTPRVLGADVETIKSALEDALRETPEAVVVNELRKDEEFEATLKFAATGHLVLATSHSTSLVETFGQLLSAMPQGNTASGRAALVDRLVSVVHIEKWDAKTYVPAMWLSTERARQAFISDGRSSIIAAPFSQDLRDKGSTGVIGRLSMLKGILDLEVPPVKERSNLEVRALESDLKGV